MFSRALIEDGFGSFAMPQPWLIILRHFVRTALREVTTKGGPFFASRDIRRWLSCNGQGVRQQKATNAPSSWAVIASSTCPLGVAFGTVV